MMKETANILEYKVGINAIIANFVCIWKSRFDETKQLYRSSRIIRSFHILTLTLYLLLEDFPK